MPRCTCPGSSCNCILQAGAGTSVEGAGTDRDPYVISAEPTYALLMFTEEGDLDLSPYDSGTVIRLELQADATGVIITPQVGLVLELVIEQGGGFTITWPSTFLFPGGTPPTLSSGVDEVDYLRLRVVSLDIGVSTLVETVGLNYS